MPRPVTIGVPKTVSFDSAAALSRPQVLSDEHGKPTPPQPVSEAAQAKQIRVRNEVPKLKFKYLKNRLITLRDIATPIIPSKPVDAYTTHGIATVHEFDLSALHEVTLRDEIPQKRKMLPNMSDSMLEKLNEQAEQTAVANRLWNDMIRYELGSFVENGTIEIVDDPFQGREVTDSDYEGAVAIHRAQPANK
jgi:hypothetical protein